MGSGVSYVGDKLDGDSGVGDSVPKSRLCFPNVGLLGTLVSGVMGSKCW
jgi:hypothetical protein